MPTEIEIAPATTETPVATTEAAKPAKKTRAPKPVVVNEASNAAKAKISGSARVTTLVAGKDYIEQLWTKPEPTFSEVHFIGAGYARDALLKEIPALKKAEAGLTFWFIDATGAEVAYVATPEGTAVINPNVKKPFDRVTFHNVLGAPAPVIETGTPAEVATETLTEPVIDTQPEPSFAETLEIASPAAIPVDASDTAETDALALVEAVTEVPAEADPHADESPKKRSRRLAREAAAAKEAEANDFAAATGE